jgi:hypothetical protein
MTKSQRLTVVLTVVNLLMLLFTLSQLRSVTAAGAPTVLRGRGLEIVDDRGKVRAQIAVLPISTLPDGQQYPETVLLRLIDPNGRPAVKIGASADGSAMSLAGDSERREWNGVQILAKAPGSSVKLTNKDRREQLITP